jgi:hypothetical protein
MPIILRGYRCGVADTIRCNNIDSPLGDLALKRAGVTLASLISGAVQIDADDLKDSGGNSVISSDGSGALTLESTPLADIEDLISNGSANKAWYPCIAEIESQVGSIKNHSANDGITNVDATDFWLLYTCGLPTNKGGKKLYVDAVRVELKTAAAADYVTQIEVVGVDHDTNTTLVTEATDRTTAGQYDTTFTAADCSSYTKVVVQVSTLVTNASGLIIRGIYVRAYYE